MHVTRHMAKAPDRNQRRTHMHGLEVILMAKVEELWFWRARPPCKSEFEAWVRFMVYKLFGLAPKGPDIRKLKSDDKASLEDSKMPDDSRKIGNKIPREKLLQLVNDLVVGWKWIWNESRNTFKNITVVTGINGESQKETDLVLLTWENCEFGEISVDARKKEIFDEIRDGISFRVERIAFLDSLEN
jgi:hypothetical protein